jgi:hypothetical protein
VQLEGERCRAAGAGIRSINGVIERLKSAATPR